MNPVCPFQTLRQKEASFCLKRSIFNGQCSLFIDLLLRFSGEEEQFLKEVFWVDDVNGLNLLHQALAVSDWQESSGRLSSVRSILGRSPVWTYEAGPRRDVWKILVFGLFENPGTAWANDASYEYKLKKESHFMGPLAQQGQCSFFCWRPLKRILIVSLDYRRICDR